MESEQVLALLLDKGKFVVAREFASLVGLTSGEITLREVFINNVRYLLITWSNKCMYVLCVCVFV